MRGEEEGDDGTEDWLNAVDRGGWVHVDDQAYRLFQEIVMVVRKHFRQATAHTFDNGSKEYSMSVILN